MEKVLLLLAAIGLIILGARGTYKAVWNQFFPNEPIVTTPVTIGAGGPSSGSAYNPTGGQPGQTPTTPVQVGQQAANATNKWISSLLPNAATGPTIKPGTSGNASNVPSVNVAPGKQAVLSTGVPSWWPSWLPYPAWFPHYGEGYTGQQVNAGG